MEIIDNFIELKDIIAKTGGKYPLYIKITNGDNTGSDKDHPDMYRFDYASTELQQISGHESEATSAGNDNLGVNIFATTVLRSRNLDVKKWSCCNGNPNGKQKLLISLPDKTTIMSGTVTFDWTLFKLFEMLGIACHKIGCNVLISGKFGGNLPTKFAKLIPSNISGDLFFSDVDHPEAISPDVSVVTGNVLAKGIKFSGWSPTSLGGDGKIVSFYNCGSLPDLSSCKIAGSLVIGNSQVSEANIPSEIGGSAIFCGCDLGKIKRLPNTGKDLIIGADNTFDISELTEKPKVKGNLQISKKLLSGGSLDKKALEEKFEISGNVQEVDDDQISKMMDDVSSKVEIGSDDRQLSRIAQIGVDAVEQAFGGLGLLALKGIYKATTGKSLPSQEK